MEVAMFVQIIQAKVKDPGGVQAETERWQKELAAGAEGFLGSTGGITPDSRFIMMARFESEEAAMKNSDKPEQGEWWERMSQHLDGEATFHNSSDVETSLQGGSDDAGFVQVMQGRVSDVEKARALGQKMTDTMPQRRPDLIGSVTANYDDGAFSNFIYFTSLEDARQNEKAMTENPPEDMAEWESIMQGEITYFDLEDPWLFTK
jgi:hypothetical protein